MDKLTAAVETLCELLRQDIDERANALPDGSGSLRSRQQLIDLTLAIERNTDMMARDLEFRQQPSESVELDPQKPQIRYMDGRVK